MTTPRLTAEFWVQAYLARLRLAGIPAFVVARGDATAGAVAVPSSRFSFTTTAPAVASPRAVTKAGISARRRRAR